MALGSRIRQARQARGLTLEQLSDLSGVEIGTISALEIRDSSRSKFATRLASSLGMSVEELESDDFDVAVVEDPVPGEPGMEYRQHRRNEDVRIPLYDTGGRMGEGGIIVRDQPGVIRQLVVSPEWVRLNLHRFTALPNLVVVTGFGDSMQPMYNPGDPLVVDTGVNTVDIDGVFFFRVEDEGYIKRLQRIPGQGIVVISENPKYRDWTITKDMDFQVFGRVIKAWRSEDF